MPLSGFLKIGGLHTHTLFINNLYLMPFIGTYP